MQGTAPRRVACLEFAGGEKRKTNIAADYAVNACKMNLQKFFDLFVVTGFATQFGNGVPKIISGLSGTELVHEIIIKAGIEQELPEVQTAQGLENSLYAQAKTWLLRE